MIRVPDLSDVLYGAAQLNSSMSVDDVRFHISMLAAEGVLQDLRGVRGRRGEYSELGAAGAALLVGIVEARVDPDPETNVQLAWLLVRRLVQMNRRKWNGLSADGEALRRLLDDELQFDFARVARWLDKHIGSAMEDEAITVVDVRIHVSSRIFQLTHDELEQVRAWSKTVKLELAAFEERHQELDVHLTALCPSDDVWPLSDGDEVRAVEERLMLADAGISLGLFGGSDGAGLDEAFNSDGLRKMLFLQPEDDPFSPRLKSWLARQGVRTHDIPTNCRQQETIAVIRGHVAVWLEDTIPEICRAKLLEEMRCERATPLFQRMREARRRLGPTAYRRKLANGGISEARANDILSDIHRFIRASCAEQMALSTALQVQLNTDPLVRHPRPETAEEPVLARAIGTLAEVSETEQLSGRELLEVMELAEREFGALAWSKAIHKGETLKRLIREVRAERG